MTLLLYLNTFIAVTCMHVANHGELMVNNYKYDYQVTFFHRYFINELKIA